MQVLCSKKNPMKKLLIAIFFILIFNVTSTFGDAVEECIVLIYKMVDVSCIKDPNRSSCIEYGRSVREIGPEGLFQIYDDMCGKLKLPENKSFCIQSAIVENNKIADAGCVFLAPRIKKVHKCDQIKDAMKKFDCFVEHLKEREYDLYYRE